MRKSLTTITFILLQLILIATPIFAEQASANSSATGTLFGNVWLDMNGDGIYQLSETPRSNVTVELKTVENEPVQSAATDADGNYLFTELEHGEYTVWVNNATGVSTLAGTIEVAEVNGTSSLNIPQTLAPLYEENTIVAPATISIFLPLINN